MVLLETISDELVEQGQGVAFQHLAVRICLIRQQVQLGAPFANPQEQRQEGGEDVQPGRKAVHLDQRHARPHAQDVEAGQDHHIQDGNMLEPGGIGQVESPGKPARSGQTGREQVAPG